MSQGAPKQLLLRNIYHLVLGDSTGSRMRGVDLRTIGGQIAEVGYELEPRGAEVIDCSTKLVIPGLVNAHHHMFQGLQRNVPAAQNVGLFEWLRRLYPIWAFLTPEALRIATQLACVELLKTGCTTTSDHHYLYPKGCPANLFEVQIDAVREMGVRFCAARGSMSRSEEQGGIPPASIVEDEDTILRRSEEAIVRFHDSSAFSMCRVALAPCTFFSASESLMKETRELARRQKVRLHTHLAETLDEERYCQDIFGCRPLELMDQWGWVGDDVWFAHGIHFDDRELAVLSRTGTGVCHCASSNMRLASGFCRVPEMLDHGIRVGLGVDGSASNDSSDMLGELRNCLLLQRVQYGPSAMSAETVLKLATTGSARLLGWDTIGSLTVGSAADLAIFEMNRLDYAGALSDPLAAIIFAGHYHQADMTIVNGEILVRAGRALRVDEEKLTDDANRMAKAMLQSAGHRTQWML